MIEQKTKVPVEKSVDMGGCRFYFWVIQGSATRIVLEVGGGMVIGLAIGCALDRRSG